MRNLFHHQRLTYQISGGPFLLQDLPSGYGLQGEGWRRPQRGLEVGICRGMGRRKVNVAPAKGKGQMKLELKKIYTKKPTTLPIPSIRAAQAFPTAWSEEGIVSTGGHDLPLVQR